MAQFKMGKRQWMLYKYNRAMATPFLLIFLQCIHEFFQRKSSCCRHYLTTDILHRCMQRDCQVQIWDVIVELVNGMNYSNLQNIFNRLFTVHMIYIIKACNERANYEKVDSWYEKIYYIKNHKYIKMSVHQEVKVSNHIAYCNMKEIDINRSLIPLRL